MSTRFDLSGKTALVTGANTGLGQAIAIALAEAGAGIVAVGRSSMDETEAAIRGTGRSFRAVHADLSTLEPIERVVSEAGESGRIDILVNNAGIIHPRIPVAEFDPQLFRDVLNVNMTGAFLITKALLPGMIERGYGKIINISSLGGRKGAAGRSAYRITKAGLISFTESLAAEVKQYGIDVNAICPGAVDTEGYREAFNATGATRNPKIGTPESIADVAVFLASDRSTAITGTAIDAFGATNPLFG
jgi:2-dehydro-3-deoxy-D-gluconate 5-dehydrogenase